MKFKTRASINFDYQDAAKQAFALGQTDAPLVEIREQITLALADAYEVPRLVVCLNPKSFVKLQTDADEQTLSKNRVLYPLLSTLLHIARPKNPELVRKTLEQNLTWPYIVAASRKEK